MIHHMSVSAQRPLHVAQVLSEIFQGQTVPFPPHPGSYMVLAMDEYGTAIEIYPTGSQIVPGSDERDGCSFVQKHKTSQFVAVHVAISVPTSQVEIERIGAREGWRVVRCARAFCFDAIEFWVENSLMLEFLTPEMKSQYLAFTQQPATIESFSAELVGTIA
jgi:hypothetical protein